MKDKIKAILFILFFGSVCSFFTLNSAVAESALLSNNKTDYTYHTYNDKSYTFKTITQGLMIETAGDSNAFIYSKEYLVSARNLKMQMRIDSLANSWFAIVLSNNLSGIRSYLGQSGQNSGIGLRFKYFDDSFKVYLDSLGQGGGAGSPVTVQSIEFGKVFDIQFSDGKVTVAGIEIAMPQDAYQRMGENDSGKVPYFGLSFEPGTASDQFTKIYFGGVLSFEEEPIDNPNGAGANELSLNLSDYYLPNLKKLSLSKSNNGINFVGTSTELPVRYMSTNYTVNSRHFKYQTVINSYGGGGGWISFVFGNDKTTPSAYLSATEGKEGFGIRITYYKNKIRVFLDELPGVTNVRIIDTQLVCGDLMVFEFKSGKLLINDYYELEIPDSSYQNLSDPYNAYFGIRIQPGEEDADILLGSKLLPGIKSDSQDITIDNEYNKVYVKGSMSVKDLKEALQPVFYEDVTIDVYEGEDICGGESMISSLNIIKLESSSGKVQEYLIRLMLKKELEYEADSYVVSDLAKVEKTFMGIKISSKVASDSPDVTKYAAISSDYTINPLDLDFRIYFDEQSGLNTSWFALVVGNAETALFYNSPRGASDDGFGVRFFLDNVGGGFHVYLDKIKGGVFSAGSNAYSGIIPSERFMDVSFKKGTITIGDISIPVSNEYYGTLQDETSAYFGVKMEGISRHSSIILSEKFPYEISSSEDSVRTTLNGEIVINKKYTVAEFKNILTVTGEQGNPVAYAIKRNGSILGDEDNVYKNDKIAIEGYGRELTILIENNILASNDEDVFITKEEIYSFKLLTASQLSQLLRCSYDDFSVEIRDGSGNIVSGEHLVRDGYTLTVKGSQDTFNDITIDILFDSSVEFPEEPTPAPSSPASMKDGCNEGCGNNVGIAAFAALAGLCFALKRLGKSH